MNGYCRHVFLLAASLAALTGLGCVHVRTTSGSRPSSETKQLNKIRSTAEAFLKTSPDLHTLTGKITDFEPLPEGYSYAGGSSILFFIPSKRIEGFAYWIGSEKGDFYVNVTVQSQWRTRVTGWKARPMKTIQGKEKEAGKTDTGK
jgi:hypothetical protein